MLMYAKLLFSNTKKRISYAAKIYLKKSHGLYYVQCKIYL